MSISVRESCAYSIRCNRRGRGGRVKRRGFRGSGLLRAVTGRPLCSTKRPLAGVPPGPCNNRYDGRPSRSSRAPYWLRRRAHAQIGRPPRHAPGIWVYPIRLRSLQHAVPTLPKRGVFGELRTPWPAAPSPEAATAVSSIAVISQFFDVDDQGRRTRLSAFASKRSVRRHDARHSLSGGGKCGQSPHLACLGLKYRYQSCCSLAVP